MLSHSINSTAGHRHMQFCWWTLVALSAPAVAWVAADLPYREELMVAVSLIGGAAAVLIALPVFLTPNARRARQSGEPRGPMAFWLFIGLGNLGTAIGQALWYYYELIAHEAPFPSMADYAFFGAYPGLIMGVLMLVAGRSPNTLRSRYALDALITTLALGVFVWHWVLGPQLEATDITASVLMKVLGISYPVCDLIVLFCLLLVSARLRDARSRAVIRPFACGLAVVFAGNAIFGFEQLSGTYVSGRLLDFTWPLGSILMSFAARQYMLLPAGSISSCDEDDSPVVPLWRSLAPYALLPLVGALVVHAFSHPESTMVDTGTYTIAAALVATIVFRQVVSITENARLAHTLAGTLASMQESEHRFRLACQCTGDLIYDWDVNGDRLQMFSSQTMDAASYSLADWMQRIHPDDRERVMSALDEHLRLGTTFLCEYRFRGQSGQEMYIKDRGMAIRDRAGNPTRMIGAMTDLTAIKLTEAELKHARAFADAANEAKSLFLANMSHEIRTPMTAILGYADLMLDPKQSPAERVDNLQRLRRSGQHLLTLINDILDLSKIEAGKMTVERIACSPCKILAEVTSILRGRAIEKGLKLQVAFDGPVPATVHTDPTRLRQILMNLIGNAIKFTHHGHVKVAVRTVGDPDADSQQLQFSILDSGIGMTERGKARLFEPFAQADSSTTRKYGGTGLGLTISSRLAEMLGGQIDVASTPGVGSTFTVTIDAGPLAGVPTVADPYEMVDAEPTETDTLTPRGLTGRILVAEDGPDNQRIIRAFLEMEGLSVEVADNGRIATERAMAEKAAGLPFDLILMDMQMPEMDGYAATSHLRSQGYTGPIIALTAHAMETDRDKCLNAGCDKFATKPIDREKLIALVARYLAPAGLAIAETPLFSPYASQPALRPLIREFVAALPERLDAIRRYAGAADLPAVAKLAHQLKGAAGSYGFAPISVAARSLEHAAAAGLHAGSVNDAVEQLASVCRCARPGQPLAA